MGFGWLRILPKKELHSSLQVSTAGSRAYGGLSHWALLGSLIVPFGYGSACGMPKLAPGQRVYAQPGWRLWDSEIGLEFEAINVPAPLKEQPQEEIKQAYR